MARFIIRMLVLIGVALGVLYALQRHAPGPPMPKALKLPEHTVRVAVEGRPSDLPLHALRALQRGSPKVNLEIVVLEQPGERWRLLAAGDVDLVLATLDEFALAVPRFNPGQILFPVALSVGSDAVVASPKAPPGDLRVAYVSGSPGEFLVSKLANQLPGERHVLPIPAPDARTARAWYESGQVGALATCEPYLGGYLAKGDEVLIQTSEAEPITQVWVASRQALRDNYSPRVGPEDIRQLAEAWFLLMGRLRHEPGLGLGYIARDNEMPVREVDASFRGLRFLTLQEAVAIRPESLVDQLGELATRWILTSAFNAAMPASFKGDVNPAILTTLSPETSAPVPPETNTPMPMPMPMPEPEPELEVEVSPSPLLTPSPAILESPSASPNPFAPPSP